MLQTPSQSCFVARSLEQLGGFKPACSPAEDYDLLLRAARLFPSRHHRTVVAQYRRHATSLSRKGTLMLRAMNHVMRLQREEVKDDPVLLSAWRQGNAYWKDHFGAAAVKELLRCLRSGQLGGACQGRRSADSICRVSDPCLALETPTPAPKPSAPESRRSRKGRTDLPGDASSGGGQRAGACE